jgi:hypothetical protein
VVRIFQKSYSMKWGDQMCIESMYHEVRAV